MSGPTSPRWTHIALPSRSIAASIAFYERFTPLRELERRGDDLGESVWLAHPGQVENPFVLVLVSFIKDQGSPHPIMAPFAHIGIEVPERADVDRIAAEAQEVGCLAWAPQDIPPPVGYICALSDPDGNVVEISHNQGVYDAVQRVWGGAGTSVRAGA